MAGSWWDKEEKIGEVDTGLTKKYVVSMNERKGQTYISIKEWWCKDRDGDWYPAQKQGINLPLEIAEEVMPFIMQAIDSYYEEFGGK